MGFLKRKSLPKAVRDHPSTRLTRMSDLMLYTYTETQVMDVGMHLTQWNQNKGRPMGDAEIEMALQNAQWLVDALAELVARQG